MGGRRDPLSPPCPGQLPGTSQNLEVGPPPSGSTPGLSLASSFRGQCRGGGGVGSGPAAPDSVSRTLTPALSSQEVSPPSNQPIQGLVAWAGTRCGTKPQPGPQPADPGEAVGASPWMALTMETAACGSSQRWALFDCQSVAGAQEPRAGTVTPAGPWPQRSFPTLQVPAALALDRLRPGGDVRRGAGQCSEHSEGVSMQEMVSDRGLGRQHA